MGSPRKSTRSAATNNAATSNGTTEDSMAASPAATSRSSRRSKATVVEANLGSGASGAGGIGGNGGGGAGSDQESEQPTDVQSVASSRRSKRMSRARPSEEPPTAATTATMPGESVASTRRQRSSSVGAKKNKQVQDEEEAELDEEEEDGRGEADEEGKEELTDLEFEGDENVDAFGRPMEGRELRCKAFLLPNRHPERLYCLVLDLARLVGYSDSFRFYKNHPYVPKTFLTTAERETLVTAGVVHPIMKFREVPFVPVAFCYKHFGVKVVRMQKRPRSLEERMNSHGQSLSEAELERIAQRKMLLATSEVLRRNEQAAMLIKDLKEPKAVEMPGSDWIYQCALATAGYNAHLRLQRGDRLWGPVQQHADHEEADSEMASRATTPISGETTPVQPQKEIIFRNGYYDVHSNVNQVPAATQYQNLRVDSMGITMESLLCKVSETIKEPKKNVDVQLDMPAMVVASSSNGGIVPRLTGVGSRANCKHSEYPLSILPGQFQESFSVFPARFGQRHMPKPLSKQNLAVTGLRPGHPSSFPILPNGSTGLVPMQQPSSFKQPPTPVNIGHSALSGKPSLRLQRSLNTPMDIGGYLCGIVTITGQPCRQKVLRDGDRCYAHRGLADGAVTPMGSSSQLSTRAAPSPALMDGMENENPFSLPSPVALPPPTISSAECNICRQHLVALEGGVDPSRVLTKLDLLETRTFQCDTCFLFYHQKCLELCPPSVEAKIRTYNWQCNDCKTCSSCRHAGEEARMLVCDACDRGYHTFCLKPPMEQLPEGSWLCDQCAVCLSCSREASPPNNNDVSFRHILGTAEEGQDRQEVYLTTICPDCTGDFDAGRFCPICLKTYPESELPSVETYLHPNKKFTKKDLIRCTTCDRHVHFACDERLGSERGDLHLYQCGICRVLDADADSDSEVRKPVAVPQLEKKRKRGRPRKYPVTEVLTAEEARKRKLVRKRHLAVWKGKRVVAPLTNQLKP